MKKFLGGTIGLLLLAGCATSGDSPKVSLTKEESLILGQDYSEMLSFLTPLGTKKRTQILSIDGNNIPSGEMYATKVSAGRHALRLRCSITFDNRPQSSNEFDLAVATEGGKTYQLDAVAVSGGQCEVRARPI